MNERKEREFYADVPRTRGDDPYIAVVIDPIYKMFPAHAGMIPSDLVRTRFGLNVPRTRGDDPTTITIFTSASQCSPHTRG